MQLAEIIENTRTAHRFENRPVDRKIIDEALEICLHAPNHKFTFPWHFYVVGDKVSKQIFDLSEAQLKEKSVEDIEQLKEKILYPQKIFFTLKKSENEITNLEDYATVSCSIQLFALYLAQHGIAYKWSTSKIAYSSDVKNLIGIKNDEQIVGMVLCGHRMTNPGPYHRPQISDVVSITD